MECRGRRGGTGQVPRRFLFVCGDCQTDDEKKGKAKPTEYQGFEDEQKPKPTCKTDPSEALSAAPVRFLIFDELDQPDKEEEESYKKQCDRYSKYRPPRKTGDKLLG